ncbi:MAG: PEGA domain-containing protein [Ignavibacteria bacterium]|nr:PEGA domain-containing protein [Ignavibacteria bacterium]
MIILILSFFCYSGCATIFVGGKEDINLSSEPSGAKILVNGQNEGKTPAIITLKRGKEYIIEFVKEGYESKTFRATYGIGAGWLILDILSGLIGVVIDAATGNWFGFDHTTYKANLEPKGK